MIRRFAHMNGSLKPAEAPSQAVWTDLLRPDPAELAEVAAAHAVELPSRAEMEEIELSSRLYWDNGAAYMTALLPARADGDNPEMGPVTFVLTGDGLVTIRYHEPRSFETYPARAQKTAFGCGSGEAVLLGLFEEIIDRLADILERVGRDIDSLSHTVFRPAHDPQGKSRDYQRLLEEIGRKGDLVSKLSDSLLSCERIMGFLGQVTTQRASHRDIRSAVKTHGRDAHSLLQHAAFLSQKTTFLLEATLGMIGIEQNAIIKIFSVAAVAFLPPTLIASVYGMNFKHMPELGWPFGYPVAISLMILSAVLPLLYFRRRGWL
ncbi:MAG TPA: magnesium transporter CorA family protein [Paracoccaceae bacterium]|nr:magnesium transporter CorA family protein [Paracoccaceae bacterium]